MFKIIVDGKVVELIMFEDDKYTIRRYVEDKYLSKGVNARVEKLIF